MPFDGRLYNPERGDAELGDAERTGRDRPGEDARRSDARGEETPIRERLPEPLAASDLTQALLSEIDSPELAEMAGLLIGQADALERHYPAAAPVPFSLPRHTTSERSKSAAATRPRRRILVVAATVLLAAGATLAGWAGAGFFAATAADAVPGANETVQALAAAPASATTAAVVDETVAESGAIPLTARRDAAHNEALLNSLLEMDGSAREGLIDLEESGDVPPGRFSL